MKTNYRVDTGNVREKRVFFTQVRENQGI